MSARRHAVVLGGTGAIGGAVVRAFARAKLACTFTFHRSEERARVLAAEHGVAAVRVDLESDDETRALFAKLERDGVVPDVLVHCATAFRPASLDDTTGDDLATACAVAGRAALVATKELSARLRAEKRDGHVVLVGALDRGQSLPLPVAHAAAQGMLGAMTMALAKELGPFGIRVNLVAAGPTGEGISKHLDPALMRDFEKLSALRRLGTVDEIANVIAFLALENEYMTGKVFPANGGNLTGRSWLGLWISRIPRKTRWPVAC